MSREMWVANAQVFTKLSATLTELDRTLASRPRCITTDDNEKKWLKRVKLRHADFLRLGGGHQFVVAVHEEQTYLITVGWKFDEEQIDLVAVPVNAGLLTAILAETEIEPLSSEALALELRDLVFYPSDATCDFHDADRISKYFAPMYAYRVDWALASWSDDEFDLRLASAGIVVSPIVRQIQWHADALLCVGALVRDIKCVPPMHLILRALTSNRPDGAFLDGCPWDAIEMVPTDDWEAVHGITLPDLPPAQPAA